MPRLFVAAQLPAAAVTALSAALTPLRARHEDLRWARAARWHMTLAFLGPLPVDQRLRTLHALRAAAGVTPPFGVGLPGRLGRFGNRVLWAAVEPVGEGDTDHLAAFVTTLRRELAGARVPHDDRPFRPHVTLARGRGAATLPRTRTLTAPGLPCQWDITTVALMASTSAQGNGYRTVATWPLGTAVAGA